MHSNFYVKCPLFSSPGAAPRNLPVLLRPAGWHRLRGSAGRGLPAAHPPAGPGPRRLLPPGPTPPAGHVFHPLQPRRLQEPARLSSAAGRLGRLLRPAGRLREGGEGKRVGVGEEGRIVYGCNMYPCSMRLDFFYSFLLKQMSTVFLFFKAIVKFHHISYFIVIVWKSILHLFCIQFQCFECVL